MNNDQVQETLFQKAQFNWNNIPTWQKRGWCVIKKSGWVVDEEIPIFSQDKQYIERQLNVESV
jgi:tRNA(His) 5'-end guanylyltransferase